MITSLVLTLIILLCLGLVITYALPPIANAVIQWCIRAIVVLITVLAICRVWNLV